MTSELAAHPAQGQWGPEQGADRPGHDRSTDDITVVDEVDDGALAVEAVERSRPDVVLMDIRMPRLDGLAATAAVRALPQAPAVSC